MRAMALVLLATLLAPLAAWGQDLEARAEQAWAARDNLHQALAAVDLYQQLATERPADDAAKIKLARATYWAIEVDETLVNTSGGSRLSKDKQVELADLGIEACQAILRKDEDNPEASYWLMWNMAARTVAKGIFSGFAFRDSVVGTIMVSKADVDYQYGGVWRYWGAVISQIPDLLGRFFHFTKDDCVWLYQRAIKAEPNYLRSRIWLAEVYENMDQDDLARKEYEYCVAADPKALPEVEIENKLYQQLAAKRLKKL